MLKLILLPLRYFVLMVRKKPYARIEKNQERLENIFEICTRIHLECVTIHGMAYAKRIITMNQVAFEYLKNMDRL